MFVVHQFEVRVIRMNGSVSEAVSGATVQLTPEAIGPTVTGAWDAVRELYYFDGLSPGFFELEVTHASYLTHTRRVQVHPKNTYVLARLTPSADFDYEAPTIPPEIHDLVGVFLASPPSDEPDTTAIDALLASCDFTREPDRPPDPDAESVEGADEGAPGTTPGRPFVVRSTTGPIPAEKADKLAQLRQSPLVRAAGPVIWRQGQTFAAVLNTLEVRFRPEVSRSERDRILADHNLTIGAERSLGVPIYQLVAEQTFGLKIYSVAASLRATGRVLFAEPTVAERWGGDQVTPGDFLWPGCWDRHLVRTDEAWELLANAHGPDTQYGSADLILAVVDMGIQSKDGDAVNPDYKGTVTSGASKMYQFYDFTNNVPNNDNTLFGDDHGVKVAGICGAMADNTNGVTGGAEGLAGAAPNVQLMGIIGSWGTFWDDPTNADAYRWIAGVSGAEPMLPPPISPGADLITSSLTFGAGDPISGFASEVLEYLSRRARSGRGAVCFFSAGNWDVQNVETYRPWGWHERAHSCAGSTLNPAGEEIRYPSSGKGQVEWCTPTNYYSPHNPPGTRRTWGGSLLHRGNMPTESVLSTTLAADAAAGTNTVTVASVTGMVPNTYLLLGEPGVDGGEPVRIATLDDATNTITFASNLLNDHFTGEVVHSGAELKATLEGGAVVGGTNLTVDDVSALSDGMILVLGTSISAETITINGAPDPATNTVPVEPLTLNHAAGEPLYIGGYHHGNNFGGTSSATPLAAGIAALVLSARPRLTWLEVGWLLRETTVKIREAETATEGRWLDAIGDPVTVVGGEVVMGIPRFSRYYGHGRLDARNAVAAALAYDYPRDLMVRNSLTDTGDVAEPAVADSPDIWVRPDDPATDAGKYPASFGAPGPHVDPEYGGDHWVYTRIHNRGTIQSLKAWVRIYVAANGATPFVWPADFEAINGVGNVDPANWASGTYLIGEVGVENIPAGGSTIVNLPWPRELMPPPVDTDGNPFSPVLLVEVTPQDGPLEGTGIIDNNNLAQRTLTITDSEPPTVEFLTTGEVQLPHVVPVPSTEANVPVPFEIRVTDLGVFVTEDISINFTWTGRDGTTTVCIYAYNSGTSVWELTPAAPVTFDINPPVDIDANPVSGNTLEARFNGTLYADGTYESVRFEVSAIDVSGNPTPADESTQVVLSAIPTDVMLVLDYSGSMSVSNDAGKTRWSSAQEAANLFNTVFGALSGTTGLDDRVGVVRFFTQSSSGPDQTEVSVPLAAPDPMTDLVNYPDPPSQHYTPIGSGVLAAAGDLVPAAPDWRSRVTILLTDGMENRTPMIEDIRTAPAGDPNFAMSVLDDAQVGMRIHSCAFGPSEEISTEAIQNLAEGIDGGKSYGGVFQATATMDDPHEAFALKELMLSMITDTITAGLIGPFDNLIDVEPGVDEMILLVTDEVSFTVLPPAEHIDPIPATVTRPGYSWVHILAPAPGIWSLSGFTPSATVRAFAVVDLSLVAKFKIASENIGVGLPLPLSAEFTMNGAPVSGATVTATVEGPNESIGEVIVNWLVTTPRKDILAVQPRLDAADRTVSQADLLANQGVLAAAAFKTRGWPLVKFTRTVTLIEGDTPGRYEASWSSTPEEGTYTVRFHAKGEVKGKPFVRDYVASRFLGPVPETYMTTLQWLSALDPDTPKMMQWTAVIKPRSNTGRLLGAGLDQILSIKDEKGERLDIEDRLDGTYAVSIKLPVGQEPGTLSMAYGDRTVSLRSSPRVSRQVRIVLERILVKDDKEPWFMSPGELSFSSAVRLIGLPRGVYVCRVPDKGVIKLADREAKDLDVVIYEGILQEGMALQLQLSGTEVDALFGIKFNEDKLARYSRTFRGDIASWKGSYAPGDEARDPEDLDDWQVWYDIDVI